MFRAGGGPERDRLAAIVGANDHLAFDAEALAAAALAVPTNDPSQTVFRGVSRCRIEEEPDLSSAKALPRSPLEAAGFMRAWMDRAVERALRGVRRVGVLTGGGLDSAAMLALACQWAKRTGGTAFAVALDFEGPGDDRPHLRALEQHLGCEVVRVSPEQAAPRIALLDGVDGAPFPWPTGPFEVELLTVARSRGAERCLSGAGGDELFDGEPRSIAAYARRGDFERALQTAQQLRGFDAPRSPIVSWLARPLLASLQPRALRTWRERYKRASAPAWAGPVTHAFLRARNTIAKGSAQRDYIAWLRHQEIVASGSDLREPFFDRDLTAAIGGLPPEWLLFGDVRRGLFRHALRDLLPESVRARLDKARFEPALARFFAAAQGFERLRPLAALPRLKALGVVTPTYQGPALDVFATEVEPWLDLWPVLAVEAFLHARERREAPP